MVWLPGSATPPRNDGWGVGQLRNPDAIIAAYIMASRRNGTLYTGVTSDLHDRVWKHKLGTLKGFNDAYACKGLVWFEPQVGMAEAIRREKQIKKWPRQWKLNLIEAGNPQWEDLAASWFA